MLSSKKYFLVLSFLFLMGAAGYSQTFADALRYSQFDFLGSNRTLGVNGSMSALGADFSTASVNPAGIGMFRSSTFAITPGVISNNNEARLIGERNEAISETDSKVDLFNAGIVFFNDPVNSNWTTANFAISFQRLASFNRKVVFEGTSQGSIVNRFQELANSNFGLDDFESGLAFQAGAIYDLEEDGFFESDVELNPEALLFRQQEINTEGFMNELQISLGGNLKEKFIFGLSVGIPFLEFREDKTYIEEDSNEEVDFFESLEFRESLAATGTGFNIKAGMIYRINQMFRVGLAVHTPTTWRIDDSFTTDLEYRYVEEGAFFDNEVLSPEGLFNYRLVTPWRYIASFGAIVNKSGFISGELEFVNYGNANFRFDDFPDDAAILNDDVAFFLGNTINARVGGEYALKAFRFRAGAGVSTAAVEDETAVGFSYGLGVGYRGRAFYASIGYNYQQQRSTYVPYVTFESPQQEVALTNRFSRIGLGLGFRF